LLEFSLKSGIKGPLFTAVKKQAVNGTKSAKKEAN
jgi:hypothetical protein